MVEQEHPIQKRRRVNRPYPAFELVDAAVIPTIIFEKNAGLPFNRLLLAKALDTTPSSSNFIMKLNASTKYGLTAGGYRDKQIRLTNRGMNVADMDKNKTANRRQALLDAALEPEMFKRFYAMLDGKRLPEDAYAEKMVQDLGVDLTLVSDCLKILKANGVFAGIIQELSDTLYVSLDVPKEARDITNDSSNNQDEMEAPSFSKDSKCEENVERLPRIFVGHAGNPEIASFIEGTLDEFGIQNSVVECDFDSSRPIAAEVVSEMQLCGAAILVFADPTSQIWNGRRGTKRNEKMMYQLGAASALYGDGVIPLKEKDSEANHSEAGFHVLEFDSDRLGEVAIAILSRLHKHGIIKITT